MEESSDDHSDDSQPDYEGYAASNIGNNPDQWEHLLNDADLAGKFSSWTKLRREHQEKGMKKAIGYVCKKLFKVLPGLEDMLQDQPTTASFSNSRVVYAPYQFGKTQSIIAYCWVRAYRDGHFVMLLLNNKVEAEKQFMERDVPAFTQLLDGIMGKKPTLLYHSGKPLNPQKLNWFHALNNHSRLRTIHQLAALIMEDKEVKDLRALVTGSKDERPLPFTLFLDEAHDNISGQNGVMQLLLDGPLKRQDLKARGDKKALNENASGPAVGQAGSCGDERVSGNATLASVVKDLVYLTASPLTPIMGKSMGKKAPQGGPAPMLSLIDIEDKPPQMDAWKQLEYCGLTNGRVTYAYWDKDKDEACWTGLLVRRNPAKMERTTPAELMPDNYVETADSLWKAAMEADPEAHRMCKELEVKTAKTEDDPEHQVKEGEAPGPKARQYQSDNFPVDLVMSLMACWSSPVLHHGLYVFSNRHHGVQSGQARLLVQVFNGAHRNGVIIAYNKQDMHLLLPKAAMGYADELKHQLMKYGKTTQDSMAHKEEGGAYVKLGLKSSTPVNSILLAIEKTRRKYNLTSFTPVLISHELTKQSVTIKANDSEPDSDIQHVTMFKMCYAAVPANEALHMEVLQSVARIAGQYQKSSRPPLYITGPVKVVNQIAALALCQQAGIEYVTSSQQGTSPPTFEGLKTHISKQIDGVATDVGPDIMKNVTTKKFLLMVSHASVLKCNEVLFDVGDMLKNKPWELSEWLTSNHPELSSTDDKLNKAAAAIRECLTIYKEGEKLAEKEMGTLSLDQAIKKVLFSRIEDMMYSTSEFGFDFDDDFVAALEEQLKESLTIPDIMKDLAYWTSVGSTTIRKCGPVLELGAKKEVKFHADFRLACEFLLDMEIKAAEEKEAMEKQEEMEQAQQQQQDGGQEETKTGGMGQIRDEMRTLDGEEGGAIKRQLDGAEGTGSSTAEASKKPRGP